MKIKYLALFSIVAAAFLFPLNASAEDLKLTDIIKGDGSVSATGDGKTTTYKGDPNVVIVEKTERTPAPSPAAAKPSPITVQNSTISGNTAGSAGGGDLKLSDIISGNGGASATGGGKTTTYTGDAKTGIESTTQPTPAEKPSTITIQNSTISGNTAGSEGGGIWKNPSTITLQNSTISGNTAGSAGGGDLKLSDIISGSGGASATGGGKTTTYSGDPKTGVKSETKSDSASQGADGDQGITWAEYYSGLGILNTDVESGKITEAEWTSKTKALRERFLVGERYRSHPAHIDPNGAPTIFQPGAGNDPFGDHFGPSGFSPNNTPGNPFDNGLGAEIFTAPGAPGSLPGIPTSDNLLTDPVFSDQRFGELFGGKFADPNDQPN